MTETIYYALSFFLILPVGFLFYFPFRHFLKKPIYMVIVANILFYLASIFLVPPLLILSNGHNLLVMLPVLALFFFMLNSFTNLDNTRSFVLFLWSTGLVSFASAFSQAFYIANSLDISDYRVLILRPVLSIIITVLTIAFTYNVDTRFVTDPNVPVSLWLTYMPVPLILSYQNTILIAYEPNMISSTKEFASYLLIMVGALVVFFILSVTFYSTATLHIQSTKLLEEKKYLEFQKNQYSVITKDVQRTNKLLHDFKHTINTLRSLATEDGSEKILSYLNTLNNTTTSTEIMNYCNHAPINSVLNHYAFRARTQNIPLRLQIDIPETLPMEDHEICSLIGNLMENAIDASMLLPESKRSFSLSVVYKGEKLMIVSSNTFDGVVKKSGDEYYSTKHSGSGIGIRSIRETIEHYGGIMNVHYDKNEFFVDIMLLFQKK